MVIIVTLSTATKIFYCNDSIITEFDIIGIITFSTAYVVMYELITLWVWTRTGWIWFNCWHILSVLLTGRRWIRTKPVGWTISFLLMTLVLVHNSIYYYIHIMYYGCSLSNWDKLFLRDIYIPRVGVAMTLCRIMRYHYSCLIGFNCIFQLYTWFFVYIMVWIKSTMWHCASVNCTPWHL